MNSDKPTPKTLWAKQQISSSDVNYTLWDKKRESLQEFSRLSRSCIFTVDVFKERYDFASEYFSTFFGYPPASIKSIRKEGDLLEERIHPDDRVQIGNYQIEHGRFIYSLPPEERNHYQQLFRYRMLNAKGQYINVTGRHQVLEEDRNGKAWIIMGVMDISPDQMLADKVKRTVIHRKTGEIVQYAPIPTGLQLTAREKEILLLIRSGLLSKEIAWKLNISIHTVNNHRKNILAKLGVDHIIEAINIAQAYGVIN